MDAALGRIAGRTETSSAAARVQPAQIRGENVVNKLFVRNGRVQVKIEVTPVLRGCVYEPEERAVSPVVERLFGFAAMGVVSFADLFAGKLVAALDRQHPRDLLASEGIDERLRTGFIVKTLGDQGWDSSAVSRTMASRQRNGARSSAARRATKPER